MEALGSLFLLFNGFLEGTGKKSQRSEMWRRVKPQTSNDTSATSNSEDINNIVPFLIFAKNRIFAMTGRVDTNSAAICHNF